MPIGKRTSDNGVRVRPKRLSRCAAAFPYLAGFLTFAVPPVHRPCRSEDTGGGRERPPPFGMPRSASQRIGMCTLMPPSEGSLPSLNQSLREGNWTDSNT